MGSNPVRVTNEKEKVLMISGLFRYFSFLFFTFGNVDGVRAFSSFIPLPSFYIFDILIDDERQKKQAFSWEKESEGIRLVQGDSFLLLKSAPDASIDLILTSPPYFGQREIRQGPFANANTPKEYLHLLRRLGKEFRRILKKEGSL